MAQKLSQELVQERLGHDAVVVTVFSDDYKKYLSTDLMREEPVKPNYWLHVSIYSGYASNGFAKRAAIRRTA